MLVERSENKVVIRHSSRPSTISQPHTWATGYCFFIDEAANMNNGRGRKWIHASAGLKANCLSRRQKKDMILKLTTGLGRKLTSQNSIFS